MKILRIINNKKLFALNNILDTFLKELDEFESNALELKTARV